MEQSISGILLFQYIQIMHISAHSRDISYRIDHGSRYECFSDHSVISKCKKEVIPKRRIRHKLLKTMQKPQSSNRSKKFFKESTRCRALNRSMCS